MNEKLNSMSPQEKAAFISKTFCHGFGEPQLLAWLNGPADKSLVADKRPYKFEKGDDVFCGGVCGRVSELLKGHRYLVRFEEGGKVWSEEVNEEELI